MAGKGSGKTRKRSKKPVKPALSVERYAYDAMTNILQYCGYPAEKIPVKEFKTRGYDHPKYLLTTTYITLATALSYRDKWRRMFESRFRSNGLDDITKIEEYLAMFLSIDAEFKEETDITKSRILLGLYSELIQFLNFKGVEVDFEQMLNSWIRYFEKNIAQKHNIDKLLQALAVDAFRSEDYLRGVGEFIKEHATPYGKTEEISIQFKQFSASQIKRELWRQIQVEVAKENIIEHVGFVPHGLHYESPDATRLWQTTASEVLAKGSELPGDRSSPEPDNCPTFKNIATKQRSRKPSAKETDASESLPGKSPRKSSAKETDVSESFLGDQDSSSSEMKIESRFESMKLDDETVSQKTQGAIPKRRPTRKLSAKARYASRRRPEGSEGSTISTEHNIDRLESASSGQESYASPDILLGLGTDLPGDRDSSDSAEHPEGDVDKSLEPSGRRSAGATGSLEDQSVKPKRKLSSKKKR